MDDLPGTRRARDSDAFLVFCELWHRVIDDNFREKILDLALEAFTEHPINFFALHPTGLLASALEAQDCLPPSVRERTMKVSPISARDILCTASQPAISFVLHLLGSMATFYRECCSRSYSRRCWI